MSMTGLVGWGSLILFALLFIWLYKFITSPSKRLEKILGDGTRLGVTRLATTSPDWQKLVEFLGPFFGQQGKNYRLGSVYKTDGRHGYLLSMVEVFKQSRPGGTTTHHRDWAKCVWICRTTVSGSFAVRPKLPDSMAVNLSMRLIEHLGIQIPTVTEGLLPEFREFFVVHNLEPASEPPAIPTGLQRVFTIYARLHEERWSLVQCLEGTQGVVFTKEGFVIHLSQSYRPRSVEDMRPLLRFAEALEKEISVRQ